MASIQRIAARVLADNVPILYVDTCSYLDVLRGQTRITSYDLQAALNIFEASKDSPPRVHLVCSSLIHGEFTKNYDSAKAELQKNFGVVTSSVNAMDIMLNASAQPQTGFTTPVNLVGEFENLCKNLKTISTAITQDPGIVLIAAQRAMSGRPPAGERRQSTKDCLIFEELISLSDACRSLGFSKPIVLLTSNKEDFHSGSSFKPEITADCSPHSIQCAKDWNSAKTFLGI